MLKPLLDHRVIDEPVFSIARRPPLLLPVSEAADGLVANSDRDTQITQPAGIEKSLYSCILRSASTMIDAGTRVTTQTEIALPEADLLHALGNTDGGENYRTIEVALARLAGAVIIRRVYGAADELIGADIEHIVDTAKLRQGSGGRVEVRVTLPQVVIDALRDRTVITLPIKWAAMGPLKRRLFEIVVRHIGHNAVWPIGFKKLSKRIGSQRDGRKVKSDILRLVKDADFAETFGCEYDKVTDVFTFSARAKTVKGTEESLADLEKQIERTRKNLAAKRETLRRRTQVKRDRVRTDAAATA